MLGRADFLGDLLHMLPDQMVARWVEENGKTPGISKGGQVRFSRIVLDVQHGELCDLFACRLALVYSVS